MGLIDYDLYKKTYRLSDKFNKLMIRVGLLWLRELERGKLQATLGAGQIRAISSLVATTAGKVDLRKLEREGED